MIKYEITGGHRLEGTVTISGAKNAAVAILPAALLVQGVCHIENVPDISDVRILLDILEDMGAKVSREPDGVVVLDCTEITSINPNPELVRKMRASYYLMGALLGRFGKAHVALPGGCNFASRPIDQHIKGFMALGADVEEAEEYVAMQHGRALEADIAQRLQLDVTTPASYLPADWHLHSDYTPIPRRYPSYPDNNGYPPENNRYKTSRRHRKNHRLPCS